MQKLSGLTLMNYFLSFYQLIHFTLFSRNITWYFTCGEAKAVRSAQICAYP